MSEDVMGILEQDAQSFGVLVLFKNTIAYIASTLQTDFLSVEERQSMSSYEKCQRARLQTGNRQESTGEKEKVRWTNS